MKKPNILEENLKPDYYSGTIKFSTDYISKIQLVEACKKIADKNSAFIQLKVRTGGGSDIAVDLLFDSALLPEQELRGAGVNYLREIFTQYLGGDYLKSYDLGNMTVVVK